MAHRPQRLLRLMACGVQPGKGTGKCWHLPPKKGARKLQEFVPFRLGASEALLIGQTGVNELEGASALESRNQDSIPTHSSWLPAT